MMKRPNDEFFQSKKVKILTDEMEEYIADLEQQRRCPFLSTGPINCVYLENNNCENHVVCPGNGDAYCFQLNDLKAVCTDILILIGNVDHSKGNGENSARTRGELLNDIRKMIIEYMPEDLIEVENI